MRVATFVVPARLETAVLAMATDAAGGATAWDARGAWDNGERVILEPVSVVRVAAARLTLVSLAARIARALAQDGESAMYCEGPDGLAAVCELEPIRVAMAARYGDNAGLALEPIVRAMLEPDANAIAVRIAARTVAAARILADGPT